MSKLRSKGSIEEILIARWYNLSSLSSLELDYSIHDVLDCGTKRHLRYDLITEVQVVLVSYLELAMLTSH